MNMSVSNLYLADKVTATDTVPVHDAQVLTGGGVQAHIVLDDKLYHLRITRAGKLILTK
ncbi:hemin uptake protein HemP [Roseicitreum antarcticum]|uniref:Hemin uptake protein hemP n=1 Tax=Roseicitreum antarcticum TaxID=564137 RepID=A0A1H2RPD1_9RHOB|nr:Hemin uptake protein hemP [Roseicitreum antarcticum]